MLEKQAQFAGTESVRAGQEIDERKLTEWLANHVPGYLGPLTIEQFKGGQSNPTYRLRTPNAEYVLRRKPPGVLLKGAHAIEREYRVITALNGVGFPVARPVALCLDEAVIGTWFYVMEMVTGRIYWDSTHPLADFTYHLMMYRLPPQIIGGFNGADLEALAIPSEAAYVDAYCRRTGRDGIAHLNFYIAFNMFRFAAILHGIKGRIARGTAASGHAQSMAANVEPLAALAWAQTREDQ